jgi:REP element-mobilizing transposase RayT
LIWGTLNRDRVLNKKAAAGLSRYLVEYADGQSVYMKINFVNPEHVHALIDLLTGFSIEKMVQLLKRSSSLDEFKRADYQQILLGVEAMEHSRYRIPMWTWSWDTSPIKKNTIACARSVRNCESSSIVTGFAGTMNEAVKTANDMQRA